MFHNGTLLITKVSRKDAGEYACAAENRQGTVAQQRGVLKVIGEKSFPHNFSKNITIFTVDLLLDKQRLFP